MADNMKVLDSDGATQTVRAPEYSAIKHQAVMIEYLSGTTPALWDGFNRSIQTNQKVTFSLDAGTAYADGDVLADTQVIAAPFIANDSTGILIDAMFVDKDDQGGAFDVFILNSNVAMGTENSGPSISDANAEYIIGYFPVVAGDWHDLGGCKVANPKGYFPIGVQAAAGTNNLYVALISRDTKTYSANGIVGIFKFMVNG